MPKAFYLLLVFALGSAHLHAQVKTLNGYLLDSTTHFPIKGGTLTNATTGKRVTTDERGFFRIELSPNQVIYAMAKDYRFDTLTHSSLLADTVMIYLSPSGAVLPTVTVTAQYNKYQLDSIRRKDAFDEHRKRLLRTVASSPSPGFGLTINLDRFFKKKYTQRKRQERTFRKTEEALYVHYRFSPELVAHYTGLRGEELRTFMLRYTPSYTWLRQHPSNEAVMYYLNEKIKEMRTNPGRQASPQAKKALTEKTF